MLLLTSFYASIKKTNTDGQAGVVDAGLPGDFFSTPPPPHPPDRTTPE